MRLLLCMAKGSTPDIRDDRFEVHGMARYRLGNSDYSFIAFEKGAPVHIHWIHQMLWPDSFAE